MGWFSSSSSSSTTTNLNYNTSYGAVTGSDLSNLFGGNTIILGDSNQMRQEASGGFGGGSLSASNSNSNTTSQTNEHKDSMDLGASVGVGGGTGGSVGVSSSDSGSLGGGINSAGVAATSNLTPIIAIGGALAVVAIMATGKKGKGRK